MFSSWSPYRQLVLSAELSLLRRDLLREVRPGASAIMQKSKYRLLPLNLTRFAHIPLRTFGVLILSGWALDVSFDLGFGSQRWLVLFAGVLLCWWGVRLTEP